MKTPSVLIGVCACGVTVAAADVERTDRGDLGAMIGKWLWRGLTVRPLFESSVAVGLGPCACPKKEEPTE